MENCGGKYTVRTLARLLLKEIRLSGASLAFIRNAVSSSFPLISPLSFILHTLPGAVIHKIKNLPLKRSMSMKHCKSTECRISASHYFSSQAAKQLRGISLHLRHPFFSFFFFASLSYDGLASKRKILR